MMLQTRRWAAPLLAQQINAGRDTRIDECSLPHATSKPVIDVVQGHTMHCDRLTWIAATGVNTCQPRGHHE